MREIYFNYKKVSEDDDYGGYYDVSDENGFIESIDPSELRITKKKYRKKGYRTLLFLSCEQIEEKKYNENRITKKELFNVFSEIIDFSKEIPEVIDWAIKQYEVFYEPIIDDLELIELVMNHLKHTIKTERFFEELQELSSDEDRKQLFRTAVGVLKKEYQASHFKVIENSADIVEKYLMNHLSIVEFLEEIEK